MSTSTSSSSTSFYIVLPSNTAVEGNRTNTFRVRLPRKLQFHSQWCVGLAVLVYPHSWPSLGTTEPQFVKVTWRTGEKLQIPVPAAHVKSPIELAGRLRTALEAGSDELAKRLADVSSKHAQATVEAELQARERSNEWKRSVVLPEQADDAQLALVQQQTQGIYERVLPNMLATELGKRLQPAERRLFETARERGIDTWIRAYEKPEHLCRFHFDPELQRFRLKLDTEFVQHVELSTQLAYILGFDGTRLSEPVQSARFMPDMTGGVASFYVYAPGLIEPVMIGDVAAPVLRIVNLRGQRDEIVEECYVAIQYHKLIMKDIDDIHIEIRTPTGHLMPFQYGTCTLTLHFKKLPYF